MTYRTRCNDNCVDRIDRQGEVIKELQDKNEQLREDLKKESQKNNMRSDQNWDGGFRVEVSE